MGAAKEKLKPLKPRTIEHRTYLFNRGELLTGSKPNRSHLTMTGEMLKDITWKTARQNVTILFSDREQAAKAAYNTGLDRPFFLLSDKEIKAIRQILVKAMDNYIDALV